MARSPSPRNKAFHSEAGQRRLARLLTEAATAAMRGQSELKRDKEGEIIRLLADSHWGRGEFAARLNHACGIVKTTVSPKVYEQARRIGDVIDLLPVKRSR